ncbi:hypothetical protein DSM25558_5007 [Agrobacterium sp. DSM 25558]|uniref:hypothetical protein n=1 Tax=Agrobacterium sp. DSM 25558 TaxID=1907665 RepID=UPI00097245ED|nr:hypothetical protein [Agrobacterium sp. DSM 25558]SCX30619.1 hypothetical protein DSM25558_5007 [Agrobacterium sp. DSM 25558]
MTKVLSTNTALADAVSYFSSLPCFTLSAVQAAWDKSQTDSFSSRGAWTSLCKDFDQVGHEHPKLVVFSEWFDGAKKGDVPRPQSPIAVPARKARLFAALPDFSPNTQDVPPLAPTSEIVGADVSIEMFATRLFDDTVASLNRDVQSRAAEIVAKRLREIAERYDALAA